MPWLLRIIEFPKASSVSLLKKKVRTPCKKQQQGKWLLPNLPPVAQPPFKVYILNN